MKKILTVGAIILGIIIILASYQKMTPQDQTILEPNTDVMERQKEGDKMMKPENTETIEQDAMVPENAMVKIETAQTAGIYTDYSASAVESALASGEKVVLFFHAPWCPSCKSADTNLREETIGADIIVFKTDYDSNVELRKKYGVTYQHTFVSLKSDGSLLKKASGLSNAAEIAELFKEK